MKIKKDDTVLITAGKSRGRKGKILKVFPSGGKILVDGVNLIKHHLKPKKSGEKGQIVTRPAALPASNVKLICPKCSKPTRVGLKHKVKGSKTKTKIRFCKKCQQEF